MATIEEMSLARQVLQLGMSITAQGKITVQVEYAGHVDSLSVWVDSTYSGWGPCDHTIYLGSFHDDCFGKKTKKGCDQLKKLLKDMDSLLVRDTDGVPV